MTRKSILFIVLVLATAGCGSSENAPPPQVMQPRQDAPPRDPSKPMTKAEKIEAIKNAPMSEDQKKVEIAKVEAGPG